MQQLEQNGIKWLEFDLLSDIPNLKHASFFRNGGQSKGPFNSLNTSYDVGDVSEHVTANLSLIQDFFQQRSSIPIQLKWAKQCHGTEVNLITPHSSQETLDCDALITNSPGQTLMIRHADCQAAIFYDPKYKAIANVHSGWRGSVKNIYKQTIEQMQKMFGSRPEDLLVCISPSLGPDDAEFIHYTYELPEEFWSFQTKFTYFNFWAISEYQLQQAGVLPHHIEIARISTYSNPHEFFSYRRQPLTGRHATCVALVK